MALVILMVGTAGALTMQASALKTTQDSRDLEQASGIAQAEIERQRALATPVAGTQTINGYTVTTTLRACSFSGTTLSCSGSGVGTDATQVTVAVTGGATDQDIELITLKSTR